MRNAAVLCALLALSACTATREATPAEAAPPDEAHRLAAALEPLGVALLPAGLAAGADGWADLDWTTRYAIESATVRRHFLVRGDEVDVFVYDSERQAQGEARRIRAAVGAAPLAARADSALAGAPASYVVAGPLVIRHRGADPRVEARLEAAFGPLDVVPSVVGPGLASAFDTLCQPLVECQQRLQTLDLFDRQYGQGIYAGQYDYTKRLYQGEYVPAWTIEPRFNRGGFTPTPAYQSPPVSPQPVPVSPPPAPPERPTRPVDDQ